jgi:hypothetical protein
VRQSSVIIDPLRNTYELCCVRNVCYTIDPLQFTRSYFHLGIIGLMVYGLAIFLHRMELCKMYLFKHTQKMVADFATASLCLYIFFIVTIYC